MGLDTALRNLIQLREKRQRLADQEGSPDYPWQVPSIAAGAAFATIEVAGTFPTSRRYEPLDYCEIVNNDVVPVTLILNGTNEIFTPAGVIRQRYFKGIRQVTIRNDSTTTATTQGAIYILLRRLSLDADEKARRSIL